MLSFIIKRGDKVAWYYLLIIFLSGQQNAKSDYSPANRKSPVFVQSPNKIPIPTNAERLEADQLIKETPIVALQDEKLTEDDQLTHEPSEMPFNEEEINNANHSEKVMKDKPPIGPRQSPFPPKIPPMFGNFSSLIHRATNLVGDAIGHNGIRAPKWLNPKLNGTLRHQLESQKKYLVPAERNSGPFNLAKNKPTKIINLTKQGNFLELEPIPNAEELVDQMDLCNKFLITKMAILRIKNLNQNKIDEYYVLPEPISGGATSRVFHASPLNAVDIDGKPINQCVSIKSVLLNLLPAYVLDDLKKEQQFLEVFRKSAHNQHIIHLFDKYEDKAKNRLIFVLERGEEDLMKRLQKMRNRWLNEKTPNEEIGREIEQILFHVVDAVSEMHKTIIHLDLKSDNMLFVNEVDDEGVEKEILKVIDFGGSEFIKPNMESTTDERLVANVCKYRGTMWSDDRYSSPEQVNLCSKEKVAEAHVYPVSSKSDIWSIGVMVIEFLLMNPTLFSYIDPVVIKTSKDEKNIYNAVLNLSRYHYAKQEVPSPDKPYREYLKGIKYTFPKFFHIIKACLRINPLRRPTARGIRQFLKGECKFDKGRLVILCDTGANASQVIQSGQMSEEMPLAKELV